MISRLALSASSPKQRLLIRSLTPYRGIHTSCRHMLLPPPNANSGPLMERRSDRALPSIRTPYFQRPFLTTFPLFLALISLAAASIFNYQKSSSSVIASALYSLRTSPVARAALGDEVTFASSWPWIWGEINSVKGKVDVSFKVKGSLGKGWVRFKGARVGGRFQTQEWSLDIDGGEMLQLLDKGSDPFQSAS